MKGGKDEGMREGEKLIGPMFPRLHVNDACEKRGGPRAPPRNKMALYEQLSVPVPRVTASAPVGVQSNGSLMPSTSNSQGVVQERTSFSSFHKPATSANSNTASNNTALDAVNVNSAANKSVKKVTSMAPNGAHILTAETSSYLRKDSSNIKNDRRLGDFDDFRVPTFTTSASAAKKVETIKERLTPVNHFPSSSTGANSNQKQVVSVSTLSSSEFQSRQENLDPRLTRMNPKTMPDSDHRKHLNGENHDTSKSALGSGATNSLCDGGPSHLKPAMATFSRSIKSIEMASGDNRFTKENSASEGGMTRVRNDLNVGELPVHENGCPNGMETPHVGMAETSGRGNQLCNGEKNDDASETSVLDSLSGLEISPDDVVGVIGPKQFWKARRAIVNQQRLFAMQVFELHRLVKVQKSIAGSPDLLFDDNSYLVPLEKVSDPKSSSDYNLKSQNTVSKPKEDLTRQAHNTKSSDTDNLAATVATAPMEDPVHGPGGRPTDVPHNPNPSPAPVSSNGKPEGWCFPMPPGNQWLVPVVSPSEGLIYKPVAGPCLPPTSFMAPIYGPCPSFSIPPMVREFPNQVYGLLPSAQPPQNSAIFPGVQSYFPHVIPMVNPMALGSEQVHATSGDKLQCQQAEQVSTAELDINMPSRISCNTSNQKSEAFSCRVWRYQSSRDTEFQGSTGSCPSERAHEAVGQASEGKDPLQLFPFAPAVENSERGNSISNEQPGRVIRVVPHNPRSATESAARIFQSIQEERQQYESL